MTITRDHRGTRTTRTGVSEPDPSPAGAAAVLEDGLCWQLRSKEHSSKAKHFLVHAEAIGAMDQTFDYVEKRTCMDADCVSARAVALERRRDLQAQNQQKADATARAWRLVSSSNGETTKADTKAAVIVSIAVATLLGWTAGSSALTVNEPLRWSAVAFLLVSVLSVVWAVRPRMPRNTTSETDDAATMNFGAVRRLSAAELAAKLRDVDELAAASSEAVELARIVHTKYVVLCWAMGAGAIGLILSLAAVAAG